MGVPYSFSPYKKKISADVPTYDLDQDYVFWLYTIDGQPYNNDKYLPPNTRNDGNSFTEYMVNAGHTIYWQLIAPDMKYG